MSTRSPRPTGVLDRGTLPPNAAISPTITAARRRTALQHTNAQVRSALWLGAITMVNAGCGAKGTPAADDANPNVSPSTTMPSSNSSGAQPIEAPSSAVSTSSTSIATGPTGGSQTGTLGGATDTTGATTGSTVGTTGASANDSSEPVSSADTSTTEVGETSTESLGTSIPGAGASKGACTIAAGEQMGDGQTTEQYYGADVTRNGMNYKMITNGWGMEWRAHDISWLGTSLSINTYDGDRQSNGAPAGYPSVFCGRYSDRSLDCGLPMPASSVTALNTAVSWSHLMGDGTYNVAYDVWFGNASATGFGGGLQSYFMVWLKDPPGESPAGSLREEGVTVTNVPGVWNIIDGEVNGLPIVNYVRAEGDELQFMAFDIMDFVRDARARNLVFPGDDLLAVAIGFEIWSGPVTGLKLEDFCLDIQRDIQ